MLLRCSDRFLPFVGALYRQFLEGGHKLKLGGSFSDALKTFPHRSHRRFSGWRQTGKGEASVLGSAGFSRGSTCFSCSLTGSYSTHTRAETNTPSGRVNSGESDLFCLYTLPSSWQPGPKLNRKCAFQNKVHFPDTDILDCLVVVWITFPAYKELTNMVQLRILYHKQNRTVGSKVPQFTRNHVRMSNKEALQLQTELH